ncbi:MAG: chromate transporter [Armatimonadetes bacterium RBG_19FT_COMBO_69_19]|nr:MAG: chromate transporter [Armatimonadetes bacterium RBG_19FT_COMBO_69_19]
MTAPGTTGPGNRARLREVASLFLRLGATAFGGPAAHIAMMRDEVVRRRRWLSDEQFLDLLGATNLIPGPNSTEMAIHTGYARAGRAGLLVAGICFIAPAMLIVLVLAWAYATYGARPQATWLLYGVKPVIIAIVVQALVALGRAALKNLVLAALALVALALYFAGINELLLLALAGLLAAGVKHPQTQTAMLLAIAPAYAASTGFASTVLAAAPVSLARMCGIFVKIGSVLYGSGYVLLAFLRSDFVVRLGWLTERQLLDAVAIGQFTPGPVFTTATFIGYLLGGTAGALLATAGIFLPAFVFVAASHPFIPRLRRSPTAAAALDGVNAASLALMAGVTVQLGRAAIVDGWTVGIALAAGAVLLLRPINSAWLVGGGALVGLLLRR